MCLQENLLMSFLPSAISVSSGASHRVCSLHGDHIHTEEVFLNVDDSEISIPRHSFPCPGQTHIPLHFLCHSSTLPQPILLLRGGKSDRRQHDILETASEIRESLHWCVITLEVGLDKWVEFLRIEEGRSRQREGKQQRYKKDDEMWHIWGTVWCEKPYNSSVRWFIVIVVLCIFLKSLNHFKEPKPRAVE